MGKLAFLIPNGIKSPHQIGAMAKFGGLSNSRANFLVIFDYFCLIFELTSKYRANYF